MNQFRSALLSWLGRLHAAAFWVGFAASVIGLVTFLWSGWKDRVEPWVFPWVRIECPPIPIRSHEYNIFGRYGSSGMVDYHVRLYVHPEAETDNEDGISKNKYRLMERKQESTRDGVWFALARCGNPGGLDMKVPPPINCTVFAVLVRSDSTVILPGSDPAQPWLPAVGGKAFAKVLKGMTTAVSSPCLIRRLPEAWCTERPRIFTPGDRVSSPVRLLWEPNKPMYVELRKGDRRFVGEVIANGTELPLAAGTWQLKVAPGRDFECLAEVWFDVRE